MSIVAKEGMRIHVFSANQKDNWGYGTIEKVEKLYCENELLCCDYPSVIKCDSGKATEGIKCWWFPIGDNKI